MHDFKETLGWYDNHQTTREIGFNPDGMCLKVCRTARGLGSMYPSAKAAQDATPEKYRVYNVRDLRKGMILYFDDPRDSNPFGHIVTMVGRVKGFDWDDMNDVLVETNSVVSGQLVVVRATYFKEHWGDSFQFGATWLNGSSFDVFSLETRLRRFKRSGPQYNMRLLEDFVRKDGRIDLRNKLERIDALVAKLHNDPERTRLLKIKLAYRKDDVLRMDQLDRVVRDSPHDEQTLHIRNALRSVLKSLPAH